MPCPDGIVNQVYQQTFKKIRIHLPGPGKAGNLQNHFLAFQLTGFQPANPFKQLGKLRLFHLNAVVFVQTDQQHQFGGQPFQPAALLINMPERAGFPIFGQVDVKQGIRIADDGGHGRFDFVGQTAQKPGALFSRPVQKLHLFLHPVSHVVEGAGQRCDLVMARNTGTAGHIALTDPDRGASQLFQRGEQSAGKQRKCGRGRQGRRQTDCGQNRDPAQRVLIDSGNVLNHHQRICIRGFHGNSPAADQKMPSVRFLYETLDLFPVPAFRTAFHKFIVRLIAQDDVVFKKEKTGRVIFVQQEMEISRSGYLAVFQNSAAFHLAAYGICSRGKLGAAALCGLYFMKTQGIRHHCRAGQAGGQKKNGGGDQHQFCSQFHNYPSRR